MTSKSYSAEVMAVASQSFKERNYWLKKLSGDLEKSCFGYDYNQSASHPPQMDTVVFRLSGKLFSRLIWITNESDIRLHMILVAGLTLLLNKHTDAENIILGTPIHEQKIAGNFINTVLVLRNHVRDNMTFRELLFQVKQTISEAIKHQNYPIKALLYDLNLPYSETGFPLFDIKVIMENIQDKQYIRHIHTNMTFSFSRTRECLECMVEYNKMLYRTVTIERIAAHFIHMMEQALFHENLPLSHLHLLSPQERKKVLEDFNNSREDIDVESSYLIDKTLHGLFEEQVEKTPGHIALVFNEKEETYQTFNEKANRLARLLRARGIGPETVTALLMASSIRMVVAIMAVLKTGAAYLPLDLELPEERKKYILEDSRVPLLLVDNHVDLLAGIIPESIEVIEIDAHHERINAKNSINLEALNTPTDLAYVIYTSGSTGNPKGVMVEHRQAVNTLVCRKQAYKITCEAAALQLFSYAFDGFITSFFTPIISGARVVLLDKQSIEDIEKIIEIIAANKVTHLISVPVLYQVLLGNMTEAEAAPLRVVTLAGDKVQPVLLEISAAKNNNIEIVNEYGITEAAVMSTIYRHQGKDRQVKIGQPIPNTAVYITRPGKPHQLVPIGVYGEMCIAGAGVTRGYMNNPELTTVKFAENPFIPHQRILKTGDLARWLPEGNIQFNGRMDLQVKIRGFRIELGEIEQQLMKHKDIDEAVVTAFESDDGEEHLCAYIVSGRKLSVTELREYLSASLSDYMIPAYFVSLESLPLSTNGKIDRKHLPPPALSTTLEEYVAPRDKTEKKLVEIWADILGIETDTIGINSNFFELGGHSLKATLLANRVHKELNVKFPMIELFKSPMIRNMAEYIKTAVEDIFASIRPAEEKDYYLLTPAQSRLYILQQMEPNSTAYNVNVIVQLEGEQKRRILEEAFKKLIARHESLRTSFEMLEEMPVQRIHPETEIEFTLEYHDLSSGHQEPANTNKDEKVKTIVKGFLRPFAMSQAPLLRVGLIKIEPLKHVLMVDMHHIITDGVSHGILIDDFISLYNGHPLPPLTLQYKDFSQWHQNEMIKKAFKTQEEYWLKEFEGEIAAADIPTDYPRPEIMGFEGSALRFDLSEEETTALNKIALEEGATMFMVLLALLNTLLSKLSGQEDIIIGTPVAGRRHADLEKIIGIFINTLALRNYPIEEKTFKVFLENLKERTLRAFENQEYQFEDLVEKLSIKRNPSRNPLFDTMFALQTTEEAEARDTMQGESDDLKMKPYGLDAAVAKFDLNLDAIWAKEKIFFVIKYSTVLFKKETIERYITYFKEIVSMVIKSKHIKLKEIALSHDFIDTASILHKDQGSDFGF